ncbi:MAG TPA: sigma-54-dependent Fis family transcriptional regulator [Deltaproteobacteria bacterium]|nr:MAG: sigma-54-dependent Fis family transcriptional regulator [Deltaproteobacteria bacterium GWA2_55_82]OIJ73713.1 MAG: sigma-54-dependent Fis family transcriptional regulator [Deltaproteobacteria bacterium GWC2_55_46]HBG45893.1 sigma-54-dependent Fis family transcriptional regulator [Deltaproteobacteria bacterium]HCY09688.1 sigma-54-dependent Fis family transcriptional regulator [Deltaproteobacteria bacterium]
MNSTVRAKIAIIDDEPNAVKVLSAILAEEGYHILSAMTAEQGIELMDSEDLDAVITDIKLPGKNGMQLFEYASERHPDVPVIFLTAYGSVDSAVQAMTRGAFYYFIKPPDYLKLKGILARALEQRRLKREVDTLRKRLSSEHIQHFIIGTTHEMRKIVEMIESVKNTASSVLITGETGTGKELIAKTLHYTSSRRENPFVAVNCAAFPRELMEAEFFGYQKGSFTGALSTRIGRFEEAEGGTLFLDEIGELELQLQAKLLRVLQEREMERLGSSKKIKVNFRLICSTNRDLKAEVEHGTFRRDLFYRINVVQLTVPPLRERRADLPLILSEFLSEVCLREKKLLTISDDVMRIFEGYPWPGNIRQLKNVVERAVVLAKKDRITIKELPEEFLLGTRSAGSAPRRHSSALTLKEMALDAVTKTLQECKGNKSKAAKMLGISRKAFYKRLKEAELA